jgi:hypothetical protein
MSSDQNNSPREPELEDTVRAEEQYLHQRLREQLGRDPTQEELDEWLREHTESF